MRLRLRARIREKSLEIKKRGFDIYLLIKASSSLSNSIEQVFKKVKQSLKTHLEEIRAQVFSLSCQVLECKAKKIWLCISRAKCLKKSDKPKKSIFLSYLLKSIFLSEKIRHFQKALYQGSLYFFEIFRGVL